MEITKQIPTDQNDQNKEEPSHYITDGIELCNFLVDFDGPKPTKLEPEYSKMVKLKLGIIQWNGMMISFEWNAKMNKFKWEF